MSKKEKVKTRSNDEELARRFYILNAVVAVILLTAIFVSISQFGAQAWQGRRQVALIIPGTKNELGWNKSQYLAAQNACDELSFDLVVRENVSSNSDLCLKTADELSKRGVNTIIFANGCLMKDIYELEKLYPKITFCTIESISILSSSGNCNVLAFEGSYLAGILAGLHTNTNKIGYIAPYMDSEVNQGINAFAMGIQRVNPNAEIFVNWTGNWNNSSSEEQAVQNLKAQGVDMLTYHQNGDTIPNACARLGINFVAFNESYPNNPRCLANIKINWNEAYMDIIKYREAYELKANYAFGINQGLVEFEILGELNKREKVLIDTAMWEIKNGRLIFSGEIFDRNGVQRCAANEAISLKSLQRNMNWLVRGVKIVGS